MSLPDIPQDLVESIRDRNCVVFVGSGLSLAAKLPSWTALLKMIFDWCEANAIEIENKDDLVGYIEEGKLIKAADLLERSMEKGEVRKVLNDIFARPDVKPTETHYRLIQLPFAAVVTTNYDLLIETAWTKFTEATPRVFNQQNVGELVSTLQSSTFYILKAHGDINDTKAVVLGTRAYNQLIHENTHFQDHLNTLFKTKKLLFVGYSLSDPDTDWLLSRERYLGEGYSTFHYALMDSSRMKESDKTHLKEHLGIKVLGYEPKDGYHPISEFLVKLNDLLTRKELSGSNANAVSHSSTTPESENIEAEEPISREAKDSELQKQLESALAAASSSVVKSNSIIGSPSQQDISTLQIVRLHLLTSTWMSSETRSTSFDTHSANLLYRYREEVYLSSREKYFILRLLLVYGINYIPGWHFLRDIAPAAVSALIFHVAWAEPNEDMRSGAFNFLAESNAPIVEPGGLKEKISALLEVESVDVKQAAIAYFGKVGGEQELKAMAVALVDEFTTVREEAIRSKFLIHSRTNPNRALKDLLEEMKTEVGKITPHLLERATNIESNLLHKALLHTNNEIRLFAVRALIAKDEL